jgi:two-component system response regulator AlgR
MRVLIVDDEPPARERLQQMLEDIGEYEVVGQARDGQQALTLTAKLRPDVVLLDIRMPGLSGLETARHLNALDDPPAIVFATAYNEYAIEAFDAQAVGYVLKPVRRTRLARALAQASRLSRQSLDVVAAATDSAERRTQICVRHADELKLIPIEDVAFFQSDNKYTRVADGEREYLIDDSLRQLENEFEDLFVRIHRSALVALSHIDALEKTEDNDFEIRLRGNIQPEKERLKVSRRHIAAVRRRLKGTGR